MHTIEIPEIAFKEEIPSCLEEMTQDQYNYFVALLLDFQDDKIDVEQFKISLIMHFLDIKMTAKFYILPKETQENIQSKIYLLSGLIDSFFVEDINEEKTVFVLRATSIQNFNRRILGKYYGPDDALQNCTFCEYRMAYTFYKSFLQTKDEQELNRMIAVLYRPKKRLLWIRKRLPGYSGEERRSFSSKTNPLFLEKRSKIIGKLPFSVRYGILLFFSGCQEHLTSGKVQIEGNEIDFSILYKKSSGSGSGDNIGLVGLLYSLAETKVFGSIEETDRMGLYDIMARLYQVCKQLEIKPKA